MKLQHPLPEHRLWIGSQNAPGSAARSVSLKTNKKSQQITYFWVWAWGALSISSNSCWDGNYYCSGTTQKHKWRDSCLSTTKLLAVTWKEKRQLWLHADTQDHVWGSSWKACRPTDCPALTGLRTVCLQLSPVASLVFSCSLLSSAVMSKWDFQNHVSSPTLVSSGVTGQDVRVTRGTRWQVMQHLS